MMMSATCKKIFSPIQIPEKGNFGAKTWFCDKKKIKNKNVENGNIFLKMFPVVTVEYIWVLKVRYESKVITEKNGKKCSTLSANIFMLKCNFNRKYRWKQE